MGAVQDSTGRKHRPSREPGVQITTRSDDNIQSGKIRSECRLRQTTDGIHTVPSEYVEEPDQVVVQCRVEQ